jgi:hypothetical protein
MRVGAVSAPVYDMHGCDEFTRSPGSAPELTSTFAQRCREILRDGEPVREGEQGEVVVTDFSRTMPFIAIASESRNQR